MQDIKQNQGRLGVFWHTQGSGKSYSMVFFSQKVLRKLPGNWTFLIVTDRQELDTQIYKNFASCGVVTEEEKRIHAQSGEHLKELLREDHRYRLHPDPEIPHRARARPTPSSPTAPTSSSSPTRRTAASTTSSP